MLNYQRVKGGKGGIYHQVPIHSTPLTPDSGSEVIVCLDISESMGLKSTFPADQAQVFRIQLFGLEVGARRSCAF